MGPDVWPGRPRRWRSVGPTTPLRAVGLGRHRVAPPQVIEDHHRPTELRRGAQDGVGHHRRRSHLEALEASRGPSSPGTDRRQSGHDALTLVLPSAVVDDQWLLTEVEQHAQGRAWNNLDVEHVTGSSARSRPGDPRQPTGPGRDGDAPRRAGTSRLSRSHVAMLRAARPGGRRHHVLPPDRPSGPRQRPTSGARPGSARGCKGPTHLECFDGGGKLHRHCAGRLGSSIIGVCAPRR